MERRQLREKLPVGPLLPPLEGVIFHSAVTPSPTRDGERLAQLEQIPATLSASVGYAIPPFRAHRQMKAEHRLPHEEQVFYRIVGLVRYRGAEGELLVQTSAPSSAALEKELVLGNPIGTLSDGTVVSSMWGHHMRWRAGDLLIDVYDMRNTIPADRLLALAESIVLK